MKHEKSTKIQIAAEADEAVEKVLAEVNREFKGGRIGKSEVVSWLLLKVAEEMDSELIAELQRAYFDEVVYLGFVVAEMRKAQKTGQPKSETLAELLAPIQCMASPDPKPRLKRRPKNAAP